MLTEFHDITDKDAQATRDAQKQPKTFEMGMDDQRLMDIQRQMKNQARRIDSIELNLRALNRDLGIVDWLESWVPRGSQSPETIRLRELVRWMKENELVFDEDDVFDSDDGSTGDEAKEKSQAFLDEKADVEAQVSGRLSPFYTTAQPGRTSARIEKQSRSENSEKVSPRRLCKYRDLAFIFGLILLGGVVGWNICTVSRRDE